MEEALLEYGILGLWTSCNMCMIWYLMKKDTAHEEKFERLLEQTINTMGSLKESTNGLITATKDLHREVIYNRDFVATQMDRMRNNNNGN